MDEAVELRSEHHIDERYRQQHREHEITGRGFQCFGASAENHAVSGLHADFVDDAASAYYRLAERNAVESRIDSDLPLPVVPADLVNAFGHAKIRNVADANNARRAAAAENPQRRAAAAGACGNHQVAEFGRIAKLFVETQINF